MNRINQLFFFAAIVMMFLLLSGCAPGNEKFDAEPAGFLYGLWHGYISLITFIISLFNDNVTIYEINNSGKMYNFGFVLGALLFYGSGSRTTCRRRRR